MELIDEQVRRLLTVMLGPACSMNLFASYGGLADGKTAKTGLRDREESMVLLKNESQVPPWTLTPSDRWL